MSVKFQMFWNMLFDNGLAEKEPLMSATKLILENGTVNPTLAQLCNRYGVSVETTTPYQEVEKQLQEKWRQSQVTHAYQITGQPPKEDDLVLLKELGCIDPIYPPCVGSELANWGPDKISNIVMERGYLVMGALRTAVVRRLAFPVTLDPTIYAIPQQFYLLGGERKLDPTKESVDVLCKPAELPFKSVFGFTSIPETEARMMQLVWDQSQLPNEWKAQLVNAKMQPKDPAKPDGDKRPPNTEDTVIEWLLGPTQAKPGYYLVGSNQPYARYQTLITERIYSKLLDEKKVSSPFYFRACGPTANLQLPLATFLDTLAKQFHEETFCQHWWTGIVKSWFEDSPMMRCGSMVAQGRTWWEARRNMLSQLRDSAENLHVSPGGYAGPFNTKTEAEAAKV